MAIYFEDLEPGQTWRVGGETVTQSEIIAFAEQYDPQPFHVDPAAAAESMFGELVASGLHTMCLAGRQFIVEFVQGMEFKNMGGLGMDDLRWHEPLRPGDTLELEIEVRDTEPSESHTDRGYAHFDRRAVVGDTPVMTFISHNVVERRTEAD
ncbi:MAG: MaoC/PaaZ C-terminal domain-containing protein [Salinirussus sp.]